VRIGCAFRAVFLEEISGGEVGFWWESVGGVGVCAKGLVSMEMDV